MRESYKVRLASFVDSLKSIKAQAEDDIRDFQRGGAEPPYELTRILFNVEMALLAAEWAYRKEIAK